MRKITVFISLLISISSCAQTGYDQKPAKTWFKDTVLHTKPVVINTQGGAIIGGYNKNADAILELSSTTRTFLPPRMTAVQRLAISSPTDGAIVFDTDSDKVCVYAGGWTCLANASSVVGATGPTGPSGSNGAAGATGATGATGPTGGVTTLTDGSGTTANGTAVDWVGLLTTAAEIETDTFPVTFINDPTFSATDMNVYHFGQTTWQYGIPALIYLQRGTNHYSTTNWDGSIGWWQRISDDSIGWYAEINNRNELSGSIISNALTVGDNNTGFQFNISPYANRSLDVWDMEMVGYKEENPLHVARDIFGLYIGYKNDIPYINTILGDTSLDDSYGGYHKREEPDSCVIAIHSSPDFLAYASKFTFDANGLTICSDSGSNCYTIGATPNAWGLTGNAGTTYPTDYIGTSDATSLAILVNGGANGAIYMQNSGTISLETAGDFFFTGIGGSNQTLNINTAGQTISFPSAATFQAFSGGAGNIGDVLTNTDGAAGTVAWQAQNQSFDSVTIYALTPTAGQQYYCTDCSGNGITGRIVAYIGSAWRRLLFED